MINKKESKGNDGGGERTRRTGTGEGGNDPDNAMKGIKMSFPDLSFTPHPHLPQVPNTLTNISSTN